MRIKTRAWTYLKQVVNAAGFSRSIVSFAHECLTHKVQGFIFLYIWEMVCIVD